MMKRKTLSILAAAAVALGVASWNPRSAEAADPWGIGIHVGGSAIHVGHGHSPHPRTHYRSRYGSYGHRYGGHYDWHDTTHYDYHPPEVRWHGNHIDVVPGHYDLHRDGHYDYHRGHHHGYRGYRGW